jgi:hypothetical protein
MMLKKVRGLAIVTDVQRRKGKKKIVGCKLETRSGKKCNLPKQIVTHQVAMCVYVGPHIGAYPYFSVVARLSVSQ